MTSVTGTSLLLTGGFSHDFPASSAAVAGLLAGLGVQTEIRADVNEALASLGAGRSYDLLTINALRFVMDDERFARHRDQYTLRLSEAARDGMLAHLARGGGLLGQHTASICFSDFPAWGEILGGSWDWDQSWHPPRGPIQVDISEPGHPITAGLPGFGVTDEVYHDLVLQPDIRPLVTARIDAASQPMLWVRHWRGSRVAYDALGHDVASITHPVHAALIRRAALWVLGRPDDELAAG